jgi:predicted N-acetyltransferase YhbS
MTFEEVGTLSVREWIGLTGREPEPFGRISAGLTFRPKDHHVVARDDDGRLAAAVGATVGSVTVGGEKFDVVGLGALIIRCDARERGLTQPLFDAVLDLALRLGPDRAMLFCQPTLAPLYARRKYEILHAVVTVAQPGGKLVMPLATMWRALRSTTWPAGDVEVDGLPF